MIAALSDRRSKHVPYRDSKLTRLLQDSLGGKANTYLITTIGPAEANESETLSSLLFASRCMRVASHPVVNEEVRRKAIGSHFRPFQWFSSSVSVTAVPTDRLCPVVCLAASPSGWHGAQVCQAASAPL